MKNWLPDLRTLYALCYIYMCAILHMCIYIYEYICTSMYMFIRCLARGASRYFFENASRFAITYLCVGQPFIFFRDLQYMKQQWYSNGALNRNPNQIRDTRRLSSIPILIQDIPACFVPRRFLKRRLTADIRLFAFFFFHPLCSFSLSGARSFHKTRSKILARSCYFSKERLVRADDPRKKIKSAKIYNIHIYMYI